MKKFYGWVPNAIGRLSFSFAGTSDYPTPVIAETNIRDGGRFFACYQRRDCSDTVLPVPLWLKRLIDKHFFQKDGDLQFVGLFKKSEKEEYVQGKVIIYQHEKWRGIESVFRQDCKLIYKLEDTQSLYENMNSLDHDYISVVRFKLHRDGIYETKVEKINTKGLGSEKGERSVEHIIASQAYFFVRDLFHKHRFHSPNTDTVLDLYEENSFWKKNANYALARKAIALRRQDSTRSLAKASGVVSYLQSFRTNVMSETERRADPVFDLSSFEKSITSAEKLAAKREAQSYRLLISKYLDWALASVAAVFAYAQIVEENFVKGENSYWLKLLVESFQENAAGTLVVSVGLLMIVKLALIKEKVEKEDFKSNLARISLAYDRHVFPLIIFIISLLIVLSGIFLVGLMFYQILLPK